MTTQQGAISTAKRLAKHSASLLPTCTTRLVPPFASQASPNHSPAQSGRAYATQTAHSYPTLVGSCVSQLKALGHVHAILVLHNDVLSNRLNPATYQILKMVDEKFSKASVCAGLHGGLDAHRFAILLHENHTMQYVFCVFASSVASMFSLLAPQQAGTSVWEHVIVGYSKCNSHETSWRSGLEKKRKELCQAIQEKERAPQPCHATDPHPACPIAFAKQCRWPDCLLFAHRCLVAM